MRALTLEATAIALVVAVATCAWAGDGDEIVVLEAETFATHHRDLAKRLQDASSETRDEYVIGAIGGTTPLPEADGRNHFLSIVHRSGYSWAESHDSIADFYVIMEGSGTLLIGGEMIDALEIDGRPGEWRSPALDGAERHELTKGDMINIPSRAPHQWDLTEDEAVTYVIVKVVESE